MSQTRHMERSPERAARSGALAGVTVVVTRPRDQADDLVEALEDRGARVVRLPTIEIVPPDDPEPLRRAAARASGYDWIVFTSVNGVAAFTEALEAAGETLPEGPARPRICAIGPATGEALAEAGLAPDVIPEEYVAEAVVETLDAADDLEGRRILQPRAAVARSALPEGLRARGAQVDVVAAYRTVRPDREAGELRRLLERDAVDLITFTASSTVRNFHEMVGADVGRAEAAAIGPITAATARELGYRVAVVAREYTIPGLVRACVRWAGDRRGTG